MQPDHAVPDHSWEKIMTGGKEDAERLIQLTEQAETMRQAMEKFSLRIRDLILLQPPVQLLGYVRGHFQMAYMTSWDDEHGPDREVLKSFQLALEYLHAVWSSHSPLTEESTPLDEAAAATLLETVNELASVTMMYCMASAAASSVGSDHGAGQVEFHAKTTWALIRGHRYQVLEGEFFHYVLEPHAEALLEAYGMDVASIADGLQAISDAFRSGFSDAFEVLLAGMEHAHSRAEAAGIDVGAMLEDAKTSDPNFISGIKDGLEDMFCGGVCNLTRHSKLSASLLDDLAFEPGGDDRFFSEGEFAGTPMRSLPARSKPAIRLGHAIYATDGQFIRDSAYRAIQWGLWKRLPYRDEWLKRQAKVVEQAFPVVFANQLSGAQIHDGVFYRDPTTGEWTEADLVVALEDVLLVVEAKAGAMPMQSPATNLASHERVIRDLVIAAYRQCRRFIDYLATAPEVPLYRLTGGAYVEVARLRQTDFRKIYPIGLTVEAFTPFSAMAKESPEVVPILGQHPFISMSVDDLFVLTRFLPTSGELLHYLDVRQAVAGLPGAHLFDETDHLGAYVLKNRFDEDLREQRDKADLVTWSHFSDIVDRYFEQPDWEQTPPPSQTYQPGLLAFLTALDRFRPKGWLAIDTLLRDFGGNGRDDFERVLSDLAPTLADHPRRRFQLGLPNPIQVWLCRTGTAPDASDIRRQGEVACLIAETAKTPVVVASFEPSGTISGLDITWVKAPSILQMDYPELQAEAERSRRRAIDLSGSSRS